MLHSLFYRPLTYSPLGRGSTVTKSERSEDGKGFHPRLRPFFGMPKKQSDLMTNLVLILRILDFHPLTTANPLAEFYGLISQTKVLILMTILEVFLIMSWLAFGVKFFHKSESLKSLR